MGKSSSRKRQRREANTAPGLDAVSIRFGESGLPPPVPADVAADREAQAADRAAFATAPGRLSFLRAPVGSEFRYAIPAGHTLDLVEVTQVAPGQRIRRPIFRPLVRTEIN